MRIAAFALILAAVIVAPAHAQTPAPKGKQPTDRILAWELETFGEASLTEVIEKVRPKFFMPDQTRIDFGLQTAWRVLVYKGMQSLGDSSILHTIKASEVTEVRMYRPNEAATRFGSDNATVILLTLKEPKKP
jgi:hypothetical protein